MKISGYRRILILGVLLLPITHTRSQESVQSVFDRLVQYYRHPQRTPMQVKSVRGKCGLERACELLDNWKRFSDLQQRQLRIALAPAQSQKDRVIGHYHFYYDTSGTDAAQMIDSSFNPIPNSADRYIDSAGVIFNHVWHTEIELLHYSPPPLDDSDGTYHVFVHNLDIGLYGQTDPDPDPIDAGTPPRFKTHIEIDNDYLPSEDYYTYGIPALEVTAAHEFHHAIQFGSYGFWGDQDRYFYEITSTWMEDVVYTDINDYYQYQSNDFSAFSQFGRPDLRFTLSDGSIEYSRSIWGKYIEKRFSRDLMRTTWQFMRQVPSIMAIDRALQTAGSSFREAYLEFAFWNLNTGPQCDTTRYYSEGKNYPTMRLDSALYFPPNGSYYGSVQTAGSGYITFCLNLKPSDSTLCGIGTNHMSAIVSNIDLHDTSTNSDYRVWNAYSDNPQNYTYQVSNTGTTGSKHLSNGLYATLLNVVDIQNWNTQESVPPIINDMAVFPNPYRTGQSPAIWFAFPSIPQQQTADLTIYSSSVQLMFSGSLPVIYARPLEPALRWDGRTSGGSTLPTGIYFYSITIDDQTRTGKFAVIRK
jgi:hypothetical protein